MKSEINQLIYLQVYLPGTFISDKKYLFAKLKNNEWLFHDINYDFLSAGHYDLYRNSENGRATIETWVGSRIYYSRFSLH